MQIPPFSKIYTAYRRFSPDGKQEKSGLAARILSKQKADNSSRTIR